MIPVPAGWTERRSGNATLLVPLDQSIAQSIRVDERVAPLRAFTAIIADVLQRSPAFIQQTMRPPTRFLTDEGEFASAVTILGSERGRPVAHVIVAVVAEDIFNVYDGRSSAEAVGDLEQTVHALAKHHRQYLGIRRRRFYFRPAPGWHVVGGLHLDVAMFPADYPLHTSIIQVWAALPIASVGMTTPIDELDRQDDAAGLALDGNQSLVPSPLNTRTLRGLEWRRARYGFSGLRVFRHVVELRDEVFAYRFRFDCGDHDLVERHREMFLDVIATAEPLPVPIAPVATPGPASDLSLLLGVD